VWVPKRASKSATSSFEPIWIMAVSFFRAFGHTGKGAGSDLFGFGNVSGWLRRSPQASLNDHP
jgi:hypothetical protein